MAAEIKASGFILQSRRLLVRARAFSSVTVVVTRLVLVRNSQTSERSSHDDGRNQDLTGLSVTSHGWLSKL